VNDYADYSSAHLWRALLTSVGQLALRCARRQVTSHQPCDRIDNDGGRCKATLRPNFVSHDPPAERANRDLLRSYLKFDVVGPPERRQLAAALDKLGQAT
jgi:hypothetical protein